VYVCPLPVATVDSVPCFSYSHPRGLVAGSCLVFGIGALVGDPWQRQGQFLVLVQIDRSLVPSPAFLGD